MTPTVEESQEIVRQRAIDVATATLKERGIIFRIEDSQQMRKVWNQQGAHLLAKEDIQGAAAVLMQARNFADFDNFLEALRGKLVKLLVRLGDDLYYDYGYTMDALACYQLALGLDPINQDALNTVVATCTPQGDFSLIELALPYAVVLRHLNPEKNSVPYVLQLIDQQK